MRKLVLFVILLTFATCTYATTNQIFDADYRHAYANCEVKFANVRACLKVAEAISLSGYYPKPLHYEDSPESFYESNTSNSDCCHDYFDLLRCVTRNIDVNKYRTLDMVSIIRNTPDFMYEYGRDSYCCSYKDGKITLNKKPYEFEGNVDSLKIVLLHPLEIMMSKICQEKFPDQISNYLDSYMEHGAKASSNIYNWFRTKSRSTVNYLCAIFSPFDEIDGLGISHSEDTLYIYGNYVRHPKIFSNECSIKLKESDYYIFFAIAQGYCHYYMPLDKLQDEQLISAVSDALYLEYLEETGSNKEYEKEWLECLYHKHNYAPMGMEFDSFVDFFHSIYVQKKYSTIEELCKKILFESRR